MADGVMPYYSSSPPPFDEDKDFKFDDDEYFSEVISSDFVEESTQLQEIDTDEKSVKDILVMGEKNDNQEDDFNDFVDYQETVITVSDKIFETTSQDSFTNNCKSDIDDRESNSSINSEQAKMDVEKSSKIQEAACKSTEIDDEFHSCVAGSLTILDSIEVDIHGETDKFDSIKVDIREDTDTFFDDSEKPAVEVWHEDIPKPELAPVEDECWAKFEAFPEIPPMEENTHTVIESDDDFGGFEEANNSLEDHVTVADLSDECRQVVFQTFHLISNNEESMATSLTDVLNLYKDGNTSQRPKNIWMDLRSVECTPALTMQWKTSHLFKSFLKILNVSTQMKTSSRISSSNVPVFATNLGLLEPKRLIDSESSEFKEETFFDIPKVEFDWASSVLVDPLDASKKEKELLDSLEPTRSDPHKSLTLDNLMATNNVTIIKSSQDSKVPPRVKVVLDRMPDLSFMRAKVLMFPLIEELVTN